jgi:hypothetical protein
MTIATTDSTSLEQCADNGTESVPRDSDREYASRESVPCSSLLWVIMYKMGITMSFKAC